MSINLIHGNNKFRHEKYFKIQENNLLQLIYLWIIL